MKIALLTTILFSLTTGLVQGDTRAYENEQLAHYLKYTGEPVAEFPMFELWQWQVVGPEKLVLWPTINTAYLVTVGKPCNRLEWAKGISVRQEMHMKVTAKFDFVDFAKQQCKITEIRPIDYKAMLKSGEAKPEEKASAAATQSS